MTRVPRIKARLTEEEQRERTARARDEAMDRAQIDRVDNVFWVCLSCHSRMKRGFMTPDWTMGEGIKPRCPLCLSPNVEEDGREPLRWK